MKVKAAICWEPKAPLEVEEIDLDGPTGQACFAMAALTRSLVIGS